MAKFEEILSDVSAKVSGDNSDEVKTSLKQLGVLFNDTVDKLTAFGGENKEKRQSIQDLTRQLRNVEDERDNLKSEHDILKTSVGEVETELNGLKSFKEDTLSKQRQGFVDKIQGVVDNPKFEKASEFFTLPEKDEDGTYLWDKLDEAQIDSNLNELVKLQKLDYFGVTTPPKKDVDGSLNSQPNNTSFENRVANATTFAELQQIQADQVQ